VTATSCVRRQQHGLDAWRVVYGWVVSVDGRSRSRFLNESTRSFSEPSSVPVGVGFDGTSSGDNDPPWSGSPVDCRTLGGNRPRGIEVGTVDDCSPLRQRFALVSVPSLRYLVRRRWVAVPHGSRTPSIPKDYHPGWHCCQSWCWEVSARGGTDL